MSDYFDYPQDERDTRVPDSKWLRLPGDCDDCGHQVSVHSSEGGVGCLHDAGDLLRNYWQILDEIAGGDDELRARVDQQRRDNHCPCLRPGTSRADQ